MQKYQNMSLVRYFLCLGVITSHYFILNGIPNIWCVGGDMRIGIFFAMSGFLIYGSYEKHRDARKYFHNRVTRILPTYFTILLLSAILLAFLSSLPANEYFSSPQFWKYLGCNALFLNFLEPSLPGVFSTENVLPAVNGALWTLKVEWAFYIFIPIFFWIVKRFRWNEKMASLAVCFLSVAYIFIMKELYHQTGNRLFHILSYQFFGQGIYFFSGVMIYHYRKYLVEKNILFPLLASVAVYSIVLNFGGQGGLLSENILFSVVPPVASVAMLSFALGKNICNFQRFLGNYSYEMYLVHFPILQTLVHFGITKNLPPLLGLLLSVAIIVLTAILVSKIVKNLKKHLLRIE